MKNRKLKIQPNLFLIGAMRCGSTSLHLILNQHPDIFMSHIKEPMFYVAEAMRRDLEKGDYDVETVAQLKTFVKNGKHRQVSTYQALFEPSKNEKYIGESSHYIYHPKVAEVIHEDCPDAKIIVSLRDPVERLHSEYLYYRQRGAIEKTFSEFVYEGCSFDKDGQLLEIGLSRITKGFYYESLREWVSIFGHKQVKIILFEDLAQDYVKVCQSIFAWLDINATFIPTPIHAQKGGVPKNDSLFDIMENFQFLKTTLKKFLSKFARERLRAFWYQLLLEREEMDPKTRGFLKDVYREDIGCLEMEFQLDLRAWK